MATRRMLDEIAREMESKKCDTCAHSVTGQCDYINPCFNWSGWKPRSYAENRKPVMVPVMFDEFALRGIHSKCYKQLDIENVIFNEPATIVFWNDGTKTVVKAAEGDEFDPEKGMAMAISKKLFGNKFEYYETFRKWVGRYEKKNKRREEGVYFSAEFDQKLMEDLLKKMPTEMKLVEVDAESLKGLNVKKGK